MNSGAIGIFDSGIGGLTVAAAVRQMLPNESTIYIGDTARVPYGPKSPDTVRRYAREILDWLLHQDVKAIVVACNTVSAHALDDLRTRSPVPVLGVIEPGARAAAHATATNNVGVIGTAGTIASGAYRLALQRISSTMRVVEQACPLFVPLVEEGWLDHEATRLVAEEYLRPLRSHGIDVLVLGCTHYPMLKPLLGEVMGPGVKLIDSAEATATELARVLNEMGLVAPARSALSQRWVATDDPARFAKVGAVFMSGSPAPVELAELGKLDA